jgi:hypothetical protein
LLNGFLNNDIGNREREYTEEKVLRKQSRDICKARNNLIKQALLVKTNNEKA